jgi:small subunit ribosomal protein S6
MAFLRRRPGGLRNTTNGERRVTEWKERALRELAPESRAYEMMIVVAPTVGEEGLPAVVERVGGYITNYGGTLKSTSTENPWGRRRLAYPINDHRDAFYALYMFDVDGHRIDELERDLRLDDDVIRHLVVRYDPMTEHEERAPRVPAEAPPVPPTRRPQAEAAPAAAPAAESAEAEPASAAEPAEATPDADAPAAATTASDESAPDAEAPVGEAETDADDKA